MPDMHQPDERDRARAEATHAVEASRPDVDVDVDVLRERAEALGLTGTKQLGRDEVLAWLRAQRPSSRHDPAAPDRPVT
jgi:hypothetical protein